MDKPGFALLAALTVAGTGAAVAQEGTILAGRCEEVIVGEQDLSSGCVDQMLVARTPAGGALTVLQGAGGAHNFYLSANPHGTVPISKVEVSFYPKEERWESVDVSGTCDLGRFPDLPATISCHATDARGLAYRLHFVATQGQPLSARRQ